MPRSRRLFAMLLSLVLAACGGGGGSITSPPPPAPPPPPPPPPPSGDFELDPVFTQLSFTAPVALLQAPGDGTRWYVVQQDGLILSFDNTSGVATTSVFADLTARVDDSEPEAGLLGMAFHPAFANNGFVYLSFTQFSGQLESVIARYTLDPGTQMLDLATEQVLLTLEQPLANHNGGHLAFGPDGFLYGGFGDGGGAGDPSNLAQATNNLYGTVIRIDVDGASPYAIPPDNPFPAGSECFDGTSPQDPCPEIYAWGFRNPWRFSFDRVAGELWLGDVGQASWEEVNRVGSGLNYGWRVREGAHCFEPPTNCATAGLIDPIAEYGRSTGRSVSGGYVYRGSAIPGLVGEYVFGDFVSGVILTVPAGAATGTAPTERLDTTLGIVSFAEDQAGELYVLDYSGGTIHQVVAAP